MLVVALMIVICLPVSSFSVVRIRDAYLLKLTAWQLVTRIRQAKIEALESGKEIRLFFDTSGNRVLYKGKSGKTEIIGFPKSVILYTTNFPSNTLFFYAAGTPSSGGTVTIRLGAQRRYIIVTPVTGRVRFSEKPPS
ncbi:MAG: type II transport protein [Candidatus Atribacteria bacterium]|nr:type II transport protein [Candidatus Atribacteria bacterium]